MRTVCDTYMPTDRLRADRLCRPTAAELTVRAARPQLWRPTAATDRCRAEPPRRPTAAAPTDRADRRRADH